jgi:site-specific recombinase XerD
MVPDVQITDAWLEAWTGFELDMTVRELSPRTIRVRKSSWSILARHAIAAGITDPAGVTKSWLTQFLISQYKDRKDSGKANFYQPIRDFYVWFSEEYQAANPIASIPRPKGQAPLPPVLSREELAKIISAWAGRDRMSVRNKALLLLLIESGMRRIELASLSVNDVHLQDRIIEIRHGKGGKSRYAAFGDQTALALSRWLRMRPEGDSEALFTSCRGDRLTVSGVSQLLAETGRKAGVPVRPHRLRHSWVHYSLENGMQEHTVAVLAGWKDTRQLTRYGASLAQQRALAAARDHQVGKIIKDAK